MEGAWRTNAEGSSREKKSKAKIVDCEQRAFIGVDEKRGDQHTGTCRLRRHVNGKSMRTGTR
jgi:hypothetical protein